MKYAILLSAALFITVAEAQVIPPNTMIPWIPNQTVGVVGGIIPRPTSSQVDVTKAPYNADNTAATSAQSAIQSALNAATNGEVVFFPAGKYDCTANGGIQLLKNNVTLRGVGSNSMIIGKVVIGFGASAQAYNGTGFTGWLVTNGTTKGSTSVTFSNIADAFSVNLGPGDSVNINALISSDSTNGGGFQYSYNQGGEPGANHFGILDQMILITNVSGRTVQFTPPLAWDFTNQASAGPLNQVGLSSQQALTNVGVENLMITTSNGTHTTTAPTMFEMQLVANSWVTNCFFNMSQNYSCQFDEVVNCYYAHNYVNWAANVGSDTAGLNLNNLVSGCLIEDNIFSDNVAPGIEFNTGIGGNAIFANFTTNTAAGLDIDFHNGHEFNNYFAENVCGETWEGGDGKGGSASHQTLFRNRFNITTVMKRWSTFMNVVGNVMGSTSVAYGYIAPFQADYSGNYVMEIGFPDEGDSHAHYTNGPDAWNYPGNVITGLSGERIAEAVFSITNTQINTNVITGVFTNLPTSNPGNYAIIGQNPTDTNKYYFIGVPTGPCTPSNVTVNANTSVTNGWNVFVVYQGAWITLQTSNILTDTITGNAVCTNQSSFVPVWDGRGSQPLTNDYMYASPPTWWVINSTNATWPAINPTGAAQIGVMPAGLIPAEARYLGISTGGGGNTTTNTINLMLTF